MVFSSPTFLFLFLPLVLALHLVLGKRLRNAGLLVASLLFYAWGEGFLVAIMLASIVANWGLGLWVARARERGGGKRAVAVSVVLNLGLLITFKYANWIWADLYAALSALGLGDGGPPPELGIHLPIGISFFTFQAMSYVIDVYRGEAEIQRNPVHFGVYIALFPQLIAGPIVRYRDVAQQIRERTVDVAGFAWGVRRFVVGLGKKMLVANVVGQAADDIFGLAPNDLTTSAAWLGLVCYTLQIYFDFSGYSDMAIGLGRMLGFRFLENFQFPYISRSVTEFWRRWHISLSTWYRDYLYIPLGGNRRGPGRTYLNLLIVFALCGLWHGASWSFLAWGLFHGTFLVIERLGLGKLIERRPAVLRHAYLLGVVMIGWVFFRAETLTAALEYLRALVGFDAARTGFYSAALYFDPLLALAIAAGLVGSAPWLPRVLAWRAGLQSPRARIALEGLAMAGLATIFLLSSMELAAGTFNPFIYFRF